MPVPGPIITAGADGSVGDPEVARPLHEDRHDGIRLAVGEERRADALACRGRRTGSARSTSVRRMRCGSTSGLDEIEYCRGWRRVNTSIQSWTSAATCAARATSTAWRPQAKRASASASLGAGEQLEVAVAGVAGEEADEVRRDPGDLEVVAQRGRRGERADAGDVDDVVGVGADDARATRSRDRGSSSARRRASRRPRSQGRPARVDDELADLLAAARPSSATGCRRAGRAAASPASGPGRGGRPRTAGPVRLLRRSRLGTGRRRAGTIRSSQRRAGGPKSGSQSTRGSSRVAPSWARRSSRRRPWRAEVGVARSRRGRARRSGRRRAPGVGGVEAPARTRRRCRAARPARTCS